MEEVWKDIKHYEGIYQVSNLGRIKRLPHRVKNRFGTCCRKDSINVMFIQIKE